MNYTAFVAALALWGRVTNPATNAAFQASLPVIIDEAERRVNRDLDLISTIITDTGNTIINTRSFTLPTAVGIFNVLESVNLRNGTDRTSLIKLSREAMDMLFPNSVSGLMPTRYAPLTNAVILLGPSPAAAYTLECIGTVNPETLSATNINTYLSTQLPDLLFSAAMISLTSYQQNWGAQADDPKIALSWQADYDKRLASADGEENRRKFQAFRVR